MPNEIIVVQPPNEGATTTTYGTRSAPPEPSEEYRRFEGLARRLVAMPKPSADG